MISFLKMAKKLVIINGSYRNKKTCDSVGKHVKTQVVLDEKDVHVHEIVLRKLNIKYCTNCKVCMHKKNNFVSSCPIFDDMRYVIDIIESADALILISPTIGGSATAVFKTFLERLAFYHYWPQGDKAPKLLAKRPIEKSLCIATSAAPSILSVFFDTHRQLSRAAKVLGCRKIRKVTIGSCYDDRKAGIAVIDRRLCSAINWLLT
ncbi:hypothetical protein B9J88_05680 [Vibrio sp. V05_P4A8T149]|nr:hypothetical protein B9J88_05680 [Vibrio sp. V05_P4A8T149]OXX29252.1 hypothetical protein B9J95_13915 [Vibrio sp. V14_P6S14T42]OXX30136.1 hypothetical protein B9J81_16670 [Vibrio sp. V04_P4A5T148]OXX51634.1 hypothetical protein B9J91_16805 [Vibrio sp. V18_P1S4T112]